MGRLPIAWFVVPGLVLMAGAGAYLWFVGPWNTGTGIVLTEEEKKRVAKAVEGGRTLYAKAVKPDCRDWDVQAMDGYRRFLLAMSIESDNVDAREGAARCALLLGRTGPAIDHADFILKRDPANAVIRQVRAEAQWMIAFEMDGHVLPRPIAALSATRTPLRPEMALKMRKQADEDFALAAGATFPIRDAEAAWRAGDLDKAEALAKSSNPRLPERDYLLAIITLERGGDSSALMGPLADRQFTPALITRARLAFGKGDWERVRLDVSQARDAHGEWAEPWHYWGMACLRLGRLAEAREAFHRLLGLDAELAKPGYEETQEAIKKYQAEGKVLPPPTPMVVPK